MVLDVPNTFIQTNIPRKKYGEERLIMKITGVLVDMILELDSQTYSNCVVFGYVYKLVYVIVLIEIYGMLVEAIFVYRKFCGDLENIGFQFNPYDPFVAYRIKFCKQHTE